MSGQASWPWHGSLSKDGYESRYHEGLPIRFPQYLYDKHMAGGGKRAPKLVQEMQMTARRAKALDILIAALLKEHSPAQVRAEPYLYRTVTDADKAMRDISESPWSAPWFRRWGVTFDMWWSGANRRATEIAEANSETG